MDNVLCGANASVMKYYFNDERYALVPESVRKELKTLCVLYCADVGGAVTFVFDQDHRLHITTIDPIDEIGAELKIKQIRADNAGLFESLEKLDAYLDSKASGGGNEA